MNTPRSLDWVAIAAGAAANLIVGFTGNQVLLRALESGAIVHAAWVAAAMWVLGGFGDALGGAIAGGKARRLGAVHGLLAGLLAAPVGLAIGMALTWLRQPEALGYLFSLSYWFRFGVQLLLGLGLSAGSGAVAAWLARRAVAARDMG